MSLDQQIHQIIQRRLAAYYVDVDADPFSEVYWGKSLKILGSKVINRDLIVRDLRSLTENQKVEDSILDYYAQLCLIHTEMEFVSIISAQFSWGFYNSIDFK